MADLKTDAIPIEIAAEATIDAKPPRVTRTRELAEKRRSANEAEALAKNANVLSDVLAQCDKAAESEGVKSIEVRVGSGCLREAVLKVLVAEGYHVVPWELDGLKIYWG